MVGYLLSLSLLWCWTCSAWLLLLWTPPGDHLWLPGLGLDLWTSAIASSLPATSPTPIGLRASVPDRVRAFASHEQGGHHRQTRPGGATYWLLETEDAEYVRRKGRWLSTRVLEIYLQEASVATYDRRMSDDTKSRIASLCRKFPRSKHSEKGKFPEEE